MDDILYIPTTARRILHLGNQKTGQGNYGALVTIENGNIKVENIAGGGASVSVYGVVKIK